MELERFIEIISKSSMDRISNIIIIIIIKQQQQRNNNATTTTTNTTTTNTTTNSTTTTTNTNTTNTNTTTTNTNTTTTTLTTPPTLSSLSLSLSSAPSSFKQGLYTFCAAFALTLWSLLTLSLCHPYQFWEHMKNSTIPYCTSHQIYVYTTTDLATDAYQLEQLIHHRQQRQEQQQQQQHDNNNNNDNNANVQHNTISFTIVKYNDSNHCRLEQDHRDDYHYIIEQAIQNAVQRMKNYIQTNERQQS